MSQRNSNDRKAPQARPGMLALLLGGAGKTSKTKKASDEKAKSQKKLRRSAKDVLRYIGYDAMYKDGIAQVEDGLFSQTIEFSDISYQSARKENQENVFTVLSSLYNYFSADTCFQLTIANVPIPDREIGKRAFFEKGDEATSKYVEEYNGILNDKMREGFSNLERHRYLTYMVGAADVDGAIPKL